MSALSYCWSNGKSPPPLFFFVFPSWTLNLLAFIHTEDMSWRVLRKPCSWQFSNWKLEWFYFLSMWPWYQLNLNGSGGIHCEQHNIHRHASSNFLRMQQQPQLGEYSTCWSSLLNSLFFFFFCTLFLPKSQQSAKYKCSIFSDNSFLGSAVLKLLWDWHYQLIFLWYHPTILKSTKELYWRLRYVIKSRINFSLGFCTPTAPVDFHFKVCQAIPM